ncbi:MAG: ATP-binding cassette domain-containing protein [Nitrospirae bacterium]|nr:MAG: ATP-binding cassette domain-containing protein [Nitrospirota bacterium]
MYAIEVDRLSKHYNGLKAVDNISFQVPGGIIFGFLGPNGAGKTTTINILCTIAHPTSGTAKVNGYDCLKQPDRVRQSIGIVFQDTTLDKDLTAYENLLYHAILYNVPKGQRRQKVEEALRFVDLYERRDDFVRRFSGGMKRRLEVARAIVHQPKVLFLDEPTIGLDPQSRKSLWDFIVRLPEEQGVTVFMTTHYMDEAEVCHQIAIIDRGRIIASGSPNELKKQVGGDVIYLKTTDNQESLRLLREKTTYEAELKDDEIFVPVRRGDACIPEIIRLLGKRVTSVRMQRPTLNDVFIKLTGKRIREEAQDSSDQLKEAIRAYRRRFDRG